MTMHNPSWTSIMRGGARDGRERVRRLVHRKLLHLGAVLAAVMLVALGGYALYTRDDFRGAERSGRAACVEAVDAMNADWNTLSRLHDRASHVFSTLDGSYDLDRLGTLLNATPDEPPTLDCEADPTGAQSEAGRLAGGYERTAAEYRLALQRKDGE